MLKKFKELYRKHFINKRKLKQQEALEIQNHIVLIRGFHYFFAKAMMTDVPEISKIENSVDMAKLWNRSAFRRDLRQKNSRLYLVLRRNDRMVAFIGCHFDYDKKDCHISNVAVSSDYQNRGLGYFLITAIIKKARSLDLATVSLEVRISNKRAIRIYHDLGFEDRGIMVGYYSDDHENALKMNLNITDLDDRPNNFGL